MTNDASGFLPKRTLTPDEAKRARQLRLDRMANDTRDKLIAAHTRAGVWFNPYAVHPWIVEEQRK